jgi:hypothetical protein
MSLHISLTVFAGALTDKAIQLTLDNEWNSTPIV